MGFSFYYITIKKDPDHKAFKEGDISTVPDPVSKSYSWLVTEQMRSEAGYSADDSL